MSMVCANAINEEYAFIGVDLLSADSYWKIKALNEGAFPIKVEDPLIEAFYLKSREKKNFLVTFDPIAYSFADVIIVDISLDVDKKQNDQNDLLDYAVDMTGFKSAMDSIGEKCKEDVLVLVETTVPPGTCKNIVYPIINKALEKRNLSTENWSLPHSYERVMPGPDYINSIQNFYRVYSGINENSADKAEVFLHTIIKTDKYPLSRLANTNATEMAKVLENSYRAMNIAFIVEWTRFAEESGVNLYEVVEAIRMRPTHKNMMLPGIGVGGYCLTKDPLLASWSKQDLFDGKPLEQSEHSVQINDKMPQYAFDYLIKKIGDIKNKRVLLLGVSYRQDVADTRYTPVELFYNYLEKAHAEVRCHDPHVTYWEEKDLIIESDLELVFSQQADIIVFSTGHSYYKNNSKLMNLILSLSEVFVYDTIGILSEEEIKLLSTKHTVKVLGRGDI